MANKELYKVWIQPKNEDCHFCDSQDRWIDIEELETSLDRLLKGPSRTIWKRVWVVDQMDFTVFDWNHEKGIVFPPVEKR